MKDEDLEKTKSLDGLKGLENNDVYEEYNNLFREKKYSNIQENLDAAKELEDAEVDQNGDIVSDEEVTVPEEERRMVETLTFDEPVNEDIAKDAMDIVNEDKKKNIFKRLIETFKGMSKKKKALVIILSLLILGAIIGLVCLLVFGKDKKDGDDTDDKEKDVIVIKDNYIYKNGNLIFLDEEDNEIGTYTCKNEDENLCYVAYEGKTEDEFYKTISMYEDESLILSRVPIFFNRYAFVYDNKQEKDGIIILYDFKNEKEVAKYRIVKTHNIDDKDYVITEEEDTTYKMYEMTETGLQSRIDKEYKYLGMMDDNETNYIVASTSSGHYLLDITGKDVSKLIGKKIFNYNKDFIVTVDNGIYSLYTYQNVQKLTGYKFINLENYIVTVDSNNNLFYRDNELIKVNDEGFTLNNDNYLPKKIYSEKGILQENIYAYQSNYTEDSITLAIRDDDAGTDFFKSISLKEYAYNKTIKNYSYSDGILYFYSDENKEALIGKYKCSNKNETFKEGELPENCHPALDTVYEDNDMTTDNGRVSMIPIYNNRYAFIYDGTTNTPSVVLYDLKDGKEVQSYASVNTYTEANKGILTFVNTDGVNVIAKSKKNGKFGMIKVEKDTVSPVYEFQYDSMELANNKILVTNGSKSKIIYSKTSTSPEFDGKIRGFIGNIDYYKVKKDNNYYVYDADGNKVSETGYKYVELYSTMYAGVDSDNKLMIYNYDGVEMIDSKVALSSTNYYGNDANAFMIANSGNKVIVEVYKDGKYESVEKNLGVKQEVPNTNTDNDSSNTDNDTEDTE